MGYGTPRGAACAGGGVVVRSLAVMRIGLIGSRGTLGRAFTRHAEAAGHTVVRMDRPDHDKADARAIMRGIEGRGLDVVVDPAAYTNVDGAESEPDAAYRVNAL